MIRDEAIAVFAYSFPHKKTQDFLLELACAGYRRVVVIAAPWRRLAISDSRVYFAPTIKNAEPQATEKVCEALGFECHEMEHDDRNGIRALRDKYKFGLGIISGARILKSSIIDLFDEGVLNLHPGKIPETSGLDLFYYTIKNRVPLGATAHFIDKRVDAGELLFFEETQLSASDTPEVVQHNNYQTQVRALRRFIAERDAGTLVRIPADRPRKNEPMQPEEKHRVLLEFPDWLAEQLRSQKGRRLIEACRNGDRSRVASLLGSFPSLINFRTAEGWTPLIVAAFHHQLEVVHTLLERGADPNTCGRNGTTPLMYAKTAIVEGRTNRFDVMQALLDAGADVTRCDRYGKNVLRYAEEIGNPALIAWLGRHQEAMS